MIRVVLPAHLRKLAGVQGEVELEIDGEVTQRAVLDALARLPTASSTDLERLSGIKRSTVRNALKELRAKLGIDQAADLVQVARARGLLTDPGPARDAGADPADD